MTKAVEDAYHTFMMQHKYPFTCLHIQIKGSDVDVNVHPTKMEVRFSDQELIYRPDLSDNYTGSAAQRTDSTGYDWKRAFGGTSCETGIKHGTF